MATSNYFKCSKVTEKGDFVDTNVFFFDDKDGQSIASAYAAAQAHALFLKATYKREPRIVAYKRPQLTGAWTGNLAIVGESRGAVEIV